MNASPAPVGSTASTWMEGMWCNAPASSTSAPRAPSVMMTTRGPRPSSRRPATPASSIVVTGRPVSVSVSVSLGTQKSQRPRSSSGRAAAGAGFRIVRTLAALATRNASSVVSMGISSWQMRTSAAWITWALRWTSSGESPMLAPGTTTMKFWALSSTKIGATPEKRVSSKNTCVVSTPCWR